MTPAELDALASEIENDPTAIGYSAMGDDYPAIAAALNARPITTEPNPDAQTQTPRRLTIDEILNVVIAEQPGAAGVIYRGSEWQPVIDGRLTSALATNDRVALGNLFGIISADLNAAAKAAVSALLAETEPDPDWQATISTTGDSRATEIGLPTVRPADVQQVRNR